MYEDKKTNRSRPPPRTDAKTTTGENKLCIRADVFGLGAFVDASDLSARVGDLVQINRVLYTDWVLYVGDGNVVHVCGLDSDSDISTDDYATVKLSSISDVAGFSGVRVNNKIVGAKERNLETFSVDRVVENAYTQLDQVVPFNMLTRNSEHYVTEWKYGHGWSDQAMVTMNVMRTLSSDSSIGHNVLVNSLNEVLNSPGSPMSRSPPRFGSSGSPLSRSPPKFTNVVGEETAST